MNIDEFKKMQNEFAALARKFLDSNVSYKTVSEALGSTIINLGPHDDKNIRRIILEATYAEIGKILGRDPSVQLTRGRFSDTLKETD